MKTITLQDEVTRIKVTLKVEKRKKNDLTVHELGVVEKMLVRSIVNGLLERIPYTDFGAETLKIR